MYRGGPRRGARAPPRGRGGSSADRGGGGDHGRGGATASRGDGGGRGYQGRGGRGGHIQGDSNRYDQAGRGRNGNGDHHHEQQQQRGRGGNNNSAPRETRPLGFEKLKKLAENPNDVELFQGLTMDGSFYALIDMNDKPHWDRRRMILTVLARASHFNVAHFRFTLHDLLRRAVASKFMQWLSEDVTNCRYRMEQFTGGGISIREDRERFMEDVCTFLAEILDKLPDAATQFIPVAVGTLDALKDESAFEVIVDEEADEPMFRRAQKRLQALWDTIVQRKQREPQDTEQNQRRGPRELDPLDDFRQLPILPREEEILTVDRPRLRRNKKEGGYTDVDHYLDILFRLLREDFVWPIRDAIHSVADQQRPQPELLAQANRGRPQKHIRVYRDAYFCEPEFDKRSATMVYEVRFDTGRLNRVNWESTRRLLQGSLLCFSSDGFRSLFFATTYDRDTRKLANGRLNVTIDQFPPGGLDRRQPYAFVESPSFYEGYKHVLKALQSIRGPEDMPFAQQLVFCVSEVQPPAYIFANPKFSFTCLLPEKMRDRGVQLEVQDVLQSRYWPRMEAIGLDGSQYEAIRQALTKRLAIIQGPPGTGKTYVGLKVVQLLLHKIKDMNLGPILLVCYTNHALDSFLDGIAEFMSDEDRKAIVRIGGTARMKESVQKFQLKNFLEDKPTGSTRLWDERNKRKEVEQNIEAMKKITRNRQNWLLASDQIRRVALDLGAEVVDLFANTPPELDGCDNETALNIWLSQAGSLSDPPVSPPEIYQAINLARFTGYEPLLCLRAFRATGNVGQHMALIWLNAIYELTCFGFDKWEAVFAMRLNGNDADAAFNWLFEWLGEQGLQRLTLKQQQQQQQWTMQTDGGNQINSANANQAQASAAIEEQAQAILAPNEVLELDRDYDEDEMNLLFGDGGGDLPFRPAAGHGDSLFTKVGAAPKLPPFIMPCIAKVQPMTREEAAVATNDAWNLPLVQRWRLYRYWQQHWFQLAEQQQRRWEQEYQRHTEQIREFNDMGLVKHLRTAKVIAMTTTGAAKKQAVLHQLEPKIVVIEEAAEVLEAHIVTSLSKGCQHLILIGDHKQLRPNPSVYELAKNYNLDISLFERLINNGFTHAMLNEQHRMRPEIADTLMPKFYDGLVNHVSVHGRDAVRGMVKNMYFVDHRHLEEADGDSTSHKNSHEAKFIVALAKYFIQQGYEADKITILACYLAQMFEIKRRVNSTFVEMDRPRVAVVDNFQGEENQLILMSMVRSNKDGRVGFLNTDNRVCVALSRARDGLYVIGNFDHLARNSPLWEDLVGRLNGAASLGPSLEIACQIHGTVRKIKTAEDFVKEAPAGGCMQLCNIRMLCGHVCNRQCHPIDAKHEETKCNRFCEKRCPDGHKCKKLCSQECGDCEERVMKLLKCGHEIKALCPIPADRVYCDKPCEKILLCGHKCESKCGDKCDRSKCYVKVVKELPCGHSAKISCSSKVASYKCKTEVEKIVPGCGHVVKVTCSTNVEANDYECPTPCGKVLKCEHNCAGTCHKCRRGRLHVKCEDDCKRILICGHECKDKCSKACPPCSEPCENRCAHSNCGRPINQRGRGHIKGRSCGEPCPVCVEKCAWECEHGKCDHECFQPCDRPRCNERCPKKLKCEHECIGVCGETCPDLCRQCQPEQYEELVRLQSEFIPIDDEDKETLMFVQLDDCKHLFNVDFLDQWFDVKAADMRSNEKASEIQLLTCLLCKTPVRTTQRYGSVTKQCLLDVQEIKIKEYGGVEELKKMRRDLEMYLVTIERKVAAITRTVGGMRTLHVLRELTTKPAEQHLNRNRLVSLGNLARLLEQMVVFNEEDFAELKKLSATIGGKGTACARFMQQFYANASIVARNSSGSVVGMVFNEIRFLIEWIANHAKTASQQMVEELGYEWRRTILLARLAEILIEATNKGTEIDTEGWSRVEEATNIINGEDSIVTDVEKRIEAVVEQLAKTYLKARLAITEKERLEIIKAVGLGERHWYKCPNGHFYTIGDCSRAYEEGKCPDCKATVGGTSHQLRPDNAPAPEMYGPSLTANEMRVLRDRDTARQAQQQADEEMARRLQEQWGNRFGFF